MQTYVCVCRIQVTGRMNCTAEGDVISSFAGDGNKLSLPLQFRGCEKVQRQKAYNGEKEVEEWKSEL